MPPSETDSDVEIHALKASLAVKKQVQKDALEAKVKAVKDEVSGCRASCRHLADWKQVDKKATEAKKRWDEDWVARVM